MQLLGRKSIGRARCADARLQLDSYIEGELDARERDLVAGHLDMCPDCQAEERRLREALSLLAAYEPFNSPRDLYAGFAARLDVTERGLRRRALQMRLAGAGALLVLVGVVGASPYVGSILFAPPASGPDLPVMPKRSAVVAESTPANDQKLTVKPVEKATASLPAEQPDPAELDIVRPDPFEPVPPSKPQKTAAAFESFLDVVPEQGPRAREQFNARRMSSIRNRRVAVKPIHNSFSAVTAVSGDSEYIPERNERIQVGDSVTTVRTGYILDEEGRRSVVNVNIGTESVPH